MKRLIGSVLLLLVGLAPGPRETAYAQTATEAVNNGQNGTTLTASKTATGHYTRTFGWTIDKRVSPPSWDLFKGDTGTSRYSVGVTKDNGTDTAYVDGQICVTNGGSVTTENLTIVDQIEYKIGSGQFGPLPGTSQTITPAPLSPGESQCYPYSIQNVPVITGATYRNVAHITITNHSGSLGTPSGPDPKSDVSFPSTPTLVNDTVHVDDTNGGSWAFSGSGSQSYDRVFNCASGLGRHEYANTATIRETGQSDEAGVIVQCFDPDVTKTAEPTLDRTYRWTLEKTGNRSSVTLAENESIAIDYTIMPTVTFSDGNWQVHGTITVSNNAPIPATVSGITDTLSDGTVADVDCPVAIPTVITAEGTPDDTLTCTYSALLTGAAPLTNTASAIQPDYAYAMDENGDETATPIGTVTTYSGTAPVDFSGALVTNLDDCITITDDRYGSLGQQCFGDIRPVTYTSLIPGYPDCGARTFTNTASFTTNSSETSGSDAWDVAVNVPCTGCTLTIGYWKNHAGLTNGNQTDIITLNDLLPQRLGNCALELLGVCLVPGKSIGVPDNQTAVNVLNMKTYGSPSNGITKLYAQLLGAKFNSGSGAPAPAVIAQADTLLTGKNWLDWSGLSKTEQKNVLSIASQLDAYNNGLAGVPHCSE